MRARYKVNWSVFNGTTQDDYGNDVESWAAPVEVFVYGVNFPKSSEPIEAGHNRLIVDAMLLVGKNFPAKERDRFSIPRDPDKTYEVEGTVEDAEGNPFGWNPGGYLKLVRVDG